jgi:hypothetical protein
MTNKQIKINIAIAKACGWTEIGQYTQAIDGWYGYEPENGLHFQVPNYCNDLNAMHEAERQMRSGDWTRYCQYLAEYGGGTVRFVSVHATAQNRAEAFLRTIGKWEGAK